MGRDMVLFLLRIKNYCSYDESTSLLPHHVELARRVRLQSFIFKREAEDSTADRNCGASKAQALAHTRRASSSARTSPRRCWRACAMSSPPWRSALRKSASRRRSQKLTISNRRCWEIAADYENAAAFAESDSNQTQIAAKRPTASERPALPESLWQRALSAGSVLPACLRRALDRLRRQSVEGFDDQRRQRQRLGWRRVFAIGTCDDKHFSGRSRA
jgi:hypothetical protein